MKAFTNGTPTGERGALPFARDIYEATLFLVDAESDWVLVNQSNEAVDADTFFDANKYVDVPF